MPKLAAEASEEQKAQYEHDKQNNSPSSHALSLLKKLPTPEQLRKDKQVPWQRLTIEKAVSLTTIRYKHFKRAKWH